MLYESLLNFFESGWFVAQNDEQTFLRLLYAGKNGGEWVCYAQAYEAKHLFIFYSILPTPVEESQQMAMAELLTRINYGLSLGNFEMDFTDGEVRYKTSIMLENDAWDDSAIRPVAFYNLAMMDHYWSALQALVIDKNSPEEALALVDAQ